MASWRIPRKFNCLIKDYVLGLAAADRCRTSVYWHPGFPAFFDKLELPIFLSIKS